MTSSLAKQCFTQCCASLCRAMAFFCGRSFHFSFSHSVSVSLSFIPFHSVFTFFHSLSIFRVRDTCTEEQRNQTARSKTRLFGERFQGRLPLAAQRHVIATPVNMSTINQKLMAVAAIIRDLTMAAGEYYYY